MMCPLCKGSSSSLYHQDKSRSYYQCQSCTLVYVPREELVSAAEEKTRYDLHENSETDQSYINYLSGIRDVILPHITKSDHGLDFGSGRTTLLEKLFIEHGYQMKSYDLYFHDHPELLKDKYDYIIMSEVIEHLRAPEADLKNLTTMLKPGSSLFVKTKLLPEEKDKFGDWFYKRDKTHVQFFTAGSFQKFGEFFGLKFMGSYKEDLFHFRHY